MPPAGRPRGVAELVGWNSGFITPRQARQIVLTPGTVLSRLLYDPADGRCIERSTGTRSPDAQMKRQIWAADRYGRGPGSRRPADRCEIDHEKEWSTHAWTAEINLNSKEALDHARKIKKLWASIMNRRRDLTWTTLLGQIARTRGHDYRQYADRITTIAPHTPPEPPEEPVPGTHPRYSDLLRQRSEQDRADLAHRRDLINQLLYAALVHRGPGERTQAHDDIVGSEDWLTIEDWGHLHHTDHNGQRRPGPPPDHPTPEHLLDLPAEPETDDSQPERPAHAGPDHGGRATSADQGTQHTTADEPATPWTDHQDNRNDDPPPF
ncbi:hypothetical protein [Ornithinimicrobium sp. Y1694]|uniref:hypothetical protein n=1 Tax=Ornithinimicrobium sp. Y1694 TaxID=3418590 RepID=UPI003CF2D37F